MGCIISIITCKLGLLNEFSRKRKKWLQAVEFEWTLCRRLPATGTGSPAWQRAGDQFLPRI